MNAARSAPSDLLTIACIALIAYGISNFTHEGIGHGGACLLVECSPTLLTSMSLHSEIEAASPLSRRIVAAGGTIANLVLGIVVLVLWRHLRSPGAWLLCWLLATISFMQAAGYLMFSGIGGIGDWAVVVASLPGGGAWRSALTVIGAVAYFVAVRWSMSLLAPRLDSDVPSVRARAGYRYALVAYASGAALYIAAGSLDPDATALIWISAVAASLGGTSGFTWGPQLLRSQSMAVPARAPLLVERNWRWIAAGSLFAGTYVLVLGPGIHF